MASREQTSPLRLGAHLGLHWRAPEAASIEEVDADIDEELAFHVDTAAREYEAQGLDKEAARRAAERSFGDLERIRRACRRQRLGERIMLQRIQLGATLALILTVGVFAQQWSTARARNAEAIVDLREQVALLLTGLEGREASAAAPEPVEHIIVQVGDELEVRFLLHAARNVTEKVARDGKILLPEIGWVGVAGKTREDVESLLRSSYEPYYAECDPRVLVHRP